MRLYTFTFTCIKLSKAPHTYISAPCFQIIADTLRSKQISNPHTPIICRAIAIHVSHIVFEHTQFGTNVLGINYSHFWKVPTFLHMIYNSVLQKIRIFIKSDIYLQILIIYKQVCIRRGVCMYVFARARGFYSEVGKRRETIVTE